MNDVLNLFLNHKIQIRVTSQEEIDRVGAYISSLAGGTYSRKSETTLDDPSWTHLMPTSYNSYQLTLVRNRTLPSYSANEFLALCGALVETEDIDCDSLLNLV